MEGGIPRGTAVGSYVIDAPIGRGGMGVVYRAYHPRLQRWAAIKMMPPFTGDSEGRDRFEREARAIARLRHRHILTVFDFGEFADQPYMAVEFMPNGALQERMPHGPVSAADAITVLRPLAEALDYAHSQGVLHRDVKPANVFLDSELQPVLADFGLAKLYSEESLTATGLVSGTPTHISPEQANGKPLSGATDQYSLAVIAYQLVAGRLPFSGDLMGLLYAHVNTPPEPPTKFNPELNPLVDKALLRALAKDAGERYASCSDFIGALEAAAAGREDERRPRPVIPAAVEAAGVAVAMPTPPAPPVRRTRRLAWVAVAVLLLLALGTVGAMARLRDRTPAGPASTPTPAATVRATTPAPRRTPTVSVNPAPPLTRGEAIAVSGGGFASGTRVRAGFLVNGSAIDPISSLDAEVGPDGGYREEGIVPRDLPTGDRILVVCGTTEADLNRCARTTLAVR